MKQDKDTSPKPVTPVNGNTAIKPRRRRRIDYAKRIQNDNFVFSV
jgi:hypothetical protein